MLSFTEIEPAKESIPWIKSYWYLSGNGGEKLRISTCGCYDLLVNLGSPVHITGTSKKVIGKNEAYLLTPFHEPALMRLSGDTLIAGLRFQYGGTGPFQGRFAEYFGVPGKYNNGSHSLSKAISRLSCEDPESILNNKAGLLEEIFLNTIDTRSRPEQDIQEAAIKAENEISTIRVKDLRIFLGISERKLQRCFTKELGISPSRFLRLVRFRQSLRLLRNRPSVSWVELSCDCGYFDQAHFIRDFRHFTGLIPGLYVREPDTDKIANFYIRNTNYQRYPSLISAIG